MRLPIVGIVVDCSDQQGTVLLDRTVLRAVLARRHGQRLPRLRRRRAPIRWTVRQRILERLTPAQRQAVRADQRASCEATSCRSPISGSQLTYGADRGRGARRDSRHRQHADGVDHRSPARARRAAGGRRVPAARSGGRSGWRRSRSGCVGLALGLAVRRGESVLPPADHRPRHRRHAPAVQVPVSVSRWCCCRRFSRAAFFSALWPAESAVRRSLVEALEYE